MPDLRLGPPEVRFWKKIEKTAICWLWKGAITGGGYGSFFDGKRIGPAHRFSYQLVKGPIPPGLTLDHLCRTKACVNPDHLEAVTLRVNILRGENRAAKQARQTHCIHGHSLADAYRKPNGARQCKVCRRRTDRIRKGLRVGNE